MAEIKLSAAALRKTFLTWFFFNGSSQSGERMQGIAFAHSMIPVINELYKNTSDKAAALKRHLMLFNVEPQIGSVIHGVVAAMEEQRANGQDIDDDAINTVKVALMGPLSGIGDTIVSGTIIPILLAIAIGITNASGVLGPICYMLFYPIVTYLYSWYLFRFGYDAGVAGIQSILSGGKLHALTESLNILGLLVMGALSASYISLTTPLKYTNGEMVLALQDILDKILPEILPLIVVALVYYLLSERKKSPIWVMGFMFIFALIGVLIQLF